MDFNLTPDQLAFKQLAKTFADEQFAPHANEWDQTCTFPVATLKQAASLGFGAIYTSETYGGTGLKRQDAALIFEALATGCPSTTAYLSIHNMVTWMIDKFGTEAQRQQYIPNLASMDFMASYCLTEAGAGSDAASGKVTARLDGDHYVINGTKSFISGGGTSDIYLVMLKTGKVEQGAKAMSALIVENGLDGLSFGAKEQKMGWNSQPTAEVVFDNVRVRKANLLGKEGEGFKIAMAGLDGGRVNIAACSLGGAQTALNQAANYMQQREQFGKKLNQFQALQFKLADMLTQLNAARLMVYNAAHSLDINAPNKTETCAQAKLFATDACYNIVDDALQLHGGYGYMKEFGIERILRDLRVHRILEGTNEIMRLIIGRKFSQDIAHGKPFE
ncbi:MAG: acyl-CoA dehydrogenase family protein [Rhizobiales bacterium]|nr:acyl-CoA dehydrogenase family protein [Hyphomicrobiales bacterium]NRB13029.1 acyl-CoA dehydrogenase family protein [Hyphomicrobiales bacterium]